MSALSLLLGILTIAPRAHLPASTPATTLAAIDCDSAVVAAPVHTPMSLVPMLKDKNDARKAVADSYPEKLRRAGISGVVGVWFLIDRDGTVERATVEESSGNPDLDEAARQAALQMEFTPPIYRGAPVCAWVSLPIAFGSAAN